MDSRPVVFTALLEKMEVEGLVPSSSIQEIKTLYGLSLAFEENVKNKLTKQEQSYLDEVNKLLTEGKYKEVLEYVEKDSPKTMRKFNNSLRTALPILIKMRSRLQ